VFASHTLAVDLHPLSNPSPDTWTPYVPQSSDTANILNLSTNSEVFVVASTYFPNLFPLEHMDNAQYPSLMATFC